MDKMDKIVEIIAHLVALVILIVFSWKYFNERQYFFKTEKVEGNKTEKKRSYVMPVYPQYMIPRSKYFLWYFIFFLFVISFYLLIFYTLSFNEDAKRVIKGMIDPNIFSYLYMAYPSLLSAILISGLLPGLPKNFDVLNLIRNFAHSRASIPNSAESYYNSIIDNGLVVTEENQNATINFVGKDYLSASDFKQRKNSIEHNWALTCYLFYKIRTWTKKPNTTYSKNRSKKPIAYDNFVENFESFKKEYKKGLPGSNEFYAEYLENHARQILNQVVQITVCLIFCSESNDEQARLKFKKLGVGVDDILEYKIQFELLFIFLVFMFFLIFIISFGVDFLLGYSSAAPEKISGTWGRNAAIIGTLLFGLPIIAVFTIKSSLKTIWPVRDQFSGRKNNMLMVSFLIGIVLGIISFFLINKLLLPGILGSKTPWLYSILSGIAGAVAAYCIDRKPKEWKFLNYSLPALFCGLITSALFAITTCGIIVITENLTVQEFPSLFDPTKYLFMIILSSALGFMISFFLSLLCDFTTKINDKNDLLNLNLSRHLIPHVNVGQFKSKDSLKKEIEKLITSDKHKLPKGYRPYLEENNLISHNGDVNENFCNKIGRLKNIQLS